jgi:tRNA 2-selenouridine synthase
MTTVGKASLALDNYRELVLAGTPMLDVRSPQEFCDACAPNAINIPLLDDQQRHLVGAEYKRVGKDAAIALGARLLDTDQRQRRVERWAAMIEQNPNTVLYCARGGMRSNISAIWLSEAGIEVPILKGGYKAVRQFLSNALETSIEQLPFVVVGGRTGIGKTHFLNTLDRHLDLEKLAKHRGSSFGRVAIPQPGNANFENTIAVELLRLASVNNQAVYIEDEARMIGSNSLPVILYEKMQTAPIVLLEESLPARIDNVIQDYIVQLLALYRKELGVQAGFDKFEERQLDSLFRVRKRFGGDNYAHALSLGKTALVQFKEHNDPTAFRPLVELLLVEYYDPMYDYQLKAKADRIVFQGDRNALQRWCNQPHNVGENC